MKNFNEIRSINEEEKTLDDMIQERNHTKAVVR